MTRLSAVPEPDPSPQPSTTQIAVLIATKDREAQLANRALRSVAAQTRQPDYLFVVDDSHRRHREANRRIVNGFQTQPGSRTQVRYEQNDRTPGASGAWNVGLDWLHRIAPDPDRVLVAILDDDDAWDPEYLAACAALAEESGLDMVAADFVRHEGAADPGSVQTAPDVLRARDFLVKNPGIQGSNLFVRLSVLLAAGLFDEALPSTTDRDLCIRIADLGFVRYGRLPRPVVQHFADGDRPRLSTPESPAKLDGLTGFFRKYHRRMTPAERDAFSDRTGRLFGWKLPPIPSPPATLSPKPSAASNQPFPFVVGMITRSVTGPGVANLLRDLTALNGDRRLSSLEIVLLENGPRGADEGRDLGAIANGLRRSGIDAVLVPIEQQAEDAKAAVFGRPFKRGADQVSIAVARTMLQTYLYLWAKRRPGAVVWILDDDMHLDNLAWRGGARVEKAQLDVIGTVGRLRESGIAIAIGTCTEAPPLPFVSCVRTQLVDAWHNLELLAALRPDEHFPELLAENMATRARFSDYYYDLSRRETDHLETPFWFVPEAGDGTAGDVLSEMVGRLPRILAGEEVFRPLVQDAALDPLQHLQPSVHRGGNCFVFDLEALREFPNGAPSFGGGETRRSDMVWSLLNRYSAGRSVSKVQLPVRQCRAAVEVQKLDLDKLVRDIHGYAIYSALEDLLLRRSEKRRAAGNGHEPDNLNLRPDELHFAYLRFRKYLQERLFAFQLSFHRAAGLARSLGRYLDPAGGWWWATDARFEGIRGRLADTIRILQTEYDLRRLPKFRDRVSDVEEHEIHEWLNALRAEIKARRTDNDGLKRTVAWLGDQRAENAKVRITEAFGPRELRRLGSGAEGVVLTDGTTVYKCIDTGRVDEKQIEFLRSHIGRWRDLKTLPCIEDVKDSGSSVILTYPFDEGKPYLGGRGSRMRLLLDECRTAGIVCSNVHPDNLIVTTKGEVKFIDFGADISLFTEGKWLLMARRAWLSARHARRPDLKELMRRSLDEGDLPELQGLDAFLRADPSATKETLVDDRLETLILAFQPRTLFDYGCGKAALAAKMALSGIATSAFDPDAQLADRWKAQGEDVRFLDRAGLTLCIEKKQRFDAVVCSLVLCVIEDDSELLLAVANLSRLVEPGGDVLVVVCNPGHVTRSTFLQHREPPANPNAKCVTWKKLRKSGVRRKDVHRPFSLLLRAFEEVGLRLVASEETPSIDPDTLEPSSDFLILALVSDGERRIA